ncbi:3'(2'),5'-bisphosphate nucleotidase CysQ [Phenylobacterium sp.]|uniref:3'(2'),5'-bisphosphate nucleotidase CysQ n=1 Tax=Phenylobacterium sp. TaxID=1871053 RepID=UPI0030F460B3
MSNFNTDIGPLLADIVEEAGRLVLPLWKSGLEVFSKADESPVTEADRRGEQLILERLETHFPGVHVISEEDASEFGTPDAIGDRFFLVDPVDGTKAFVRGDPNFTVNIALIENRRPVAGAVCAPASGETWYTQGGQTMKRVVGEAGKPVQARTWPQGAAVALVSHTMKEDTLKALADKYGFDATSAMDSSIKFCRLAEGSADVYPRHGPTMEWDIAAGHAVLEAAGGSVLTPEGEAFVYGKADEKFRNGAFVARGK